MNIENRVDFYCWLCGTGFMFLVFVWLYSVSCSQRYNETARVCSFVDKQASHSIKVESLVYKIKYACGKAK